MLAKPCRKLILPLSVLFILLLVGMAHHFHSQNSYHDGQDCFHAPTVQLIVDSHHDFLACTTPSFSYAPIVTEGELTPSDSAVLTPYDSTHIFAGRAPPA